MDIYSLPCDECGAVAGQPCKSMWCPRVADREIGDSDAPDIEWHEREELEEYYETDKSEDSSSEYFETYFYGEPFPTFDEDYYDFAREIVSHTFSDPGSRAMAREYINRFEECAPQEAFRSYRKMVEEQENDWKARVAYYYGNWGYLNDHQD